MAAPATPPPPMDLFSPQFKADPFPTWARLRQEYPIYPHRAPDGTTIWYITRYEDVAAVLRDDFHFCKDPRHARSSEHESEPRAASADSLSHLINENMLFSDPPAHTRLRALVSQAFTPRRVEAMSPRIQAIATALLEQATPQSGTDLIASFALPLPVYVISELLGIPQQDREQVARWSQAIISPGSRNLNYSARKRQVRAFVAYLRDMFAERRAHPGEDMVSALVLAEEAGARLSEAELSSMIALLLVTGHETTVNLIGNGALALLQHPEQLALLRADPDLWKPAVEELLRFDGPVETSTSRWVRREHDMQGFALKRGDLVRVVLASANRDSSQIQRPDQLDVQRTDNRHLAFGLGTHYCLGASLARLEGQLALATLFDRFPAMELATGPSALEWRSGILFRGLKRLDVRYHGRGA